MKKILTLGLLPALALAACNGGTTENGTANTSDTGVANAGLATDTMTPGNEADNALMTGEAATPSQKFANDVGASDFFEIQSGKMAQEKAQNQALKDFGGMIVQHHTESTQKLTAAGAKAEPAIVPNPALNAEQEANLAALEKAEGAAFDTLFKQQQAIAHEKALTLLKGYESSGDVAALKTFAADAQKVVQSHLTKIKSL
ncbi:DUF4142 domain-containing protein [Sphingomonas sp. IC-56]|uniref:DUF4142 domain-containing protein n=1 Tax=Sphingomonas sp. IC-56 TaxID=2898529 RepID=UPI001E63CF6C|nr:DUF4142 domain-containing protein [Sphingomonas sp. IC-56]MCD2322679.1 DUF4142 domain-containing protein [Sphingomonas sp. IC-56]